MFALKFCCFPADSRVVSIIEAVKVRLWSVMTSRFITPSPPGDGPPVGFLIIRAVGLPMEANKFSLRARSASTACLLRSHLIALLFFLATCGVSVAGALPHDGFHIHEDMLLPVYDHVYIGDDPPDCTDAEANTLAYGHDHTLLICTGGEHGNGWQPIVIDGTAPCDTSAR